MYMNIKIEKNIICDFWQPNMLYKMEEETPPTSK